MKLQNCKSVLIVTASFSKAKLAESERVYYLVKSLLKHGVAVTVLTTKCKDNYKLKGDIIVVDSLPIPLLKFNLLNRIISPIADGLLPTYFMNKKKIISSVEQNYDFVISSSPPHSIHYLGLLLANKKNAPFMLDLRDAWKHNKLVKYGTFIHKFFSNLAYKSFLSQADVIIANTPQLKDLVSKDRFNCEVVSVPNGYPRESFENITPILNSNNLKMLYSGGHYGEKAVNIISKLLPKSSSYSVDFLGEPFTPAYGCNYIGKVSSQEVPLKLLSYDALIIYMPPEENGSARVLLKAYGYAKSGKDIIYIGAKNATYDFLNFMSNIHYVEENDLATFSEILAKLEVTRSQQGINKIDFSFESNFEKLIKRELCLKIKSY
ncbi:glycosyltransferase [Pseudoalteromonas sp. SR43-3]|uniref:glycosyltransferase n=1 Tax=Pseudoalteromonas sp. SR43-3 TaxID=2760943 RepID=UPI00160169B2|nr:glycosyltransferase [Pseudoalteromonas sp. SR43-3]MBB1275951.1 glycosyltransferase [Pseudoalteromonas sp. SR43-3]